MCALFGFSSYKGKAGIKLLRKLTQSLANAAEERGIDAAGIAYTYLGKVIVYKKPKAAHKIKFHVPACANAVMGHTRMATQGDKDKNYNNHPFIARAGKKFAFAHNGVLYNDNELREKYSLPETRIETDSYVAVQLIEQQGELNFDSLRFMAETVKGTFTFTVLDQENSLYIIKGDNPLVLVHFKELGLYVYASTRSILNQALYETGLNRTKFTVINLHDGDIVKIDNTGKLEHSEFTSNNYRIPVYDSWCHLYHFDDLNNLDEDDSVSQLLEICSSFGTDPSDVMTLLESGYYSVEEIEEMLYEPELIKDAVECCAIV
ncbi:MAG: class II glutamine amidotransferase [Oscillospiraceae bacterium]|nr:class II glutamine amidotransferase [Oscillospiraceae bacterium]